VLVDACSAAIDSASSISGWSGESVETHGSHEESVRDQSPWRRSQLSAHEARALGFLVDADGITMNRERVLTDAKTRALATRARGYEPPVMRSDFPHGRKHPGYAEMGVYLMRQGDYISDHEVKIGNKVAEVLCGGNVTPARR